MRGQIDMQEQLKNMSSYVSKQLKAKFGKGPESCYCIYQHHFLIFYIRKFVSPMEQVLLNKGEYSLCYQSRVSVLQSMIPKLKAMIEEQINIPVKHIYHDWDCAADSGVMIALLPEESKMGERKEGSGFHEDLHIQSMKRQLMQVVKSIHKPANVNRLYALNHNFYLFEQKEVLMYMEKFLYDQGYDHLLLVGTLELRCQWLQYKHQLEEVLNCSIQNIYVDVDFEQDQSILCLQGA